MKQILDYIDNHKGFIKKIIYFTLTLIVYKIFSAPQTQDILKTMLDGLFTTAFVCIGGKH